MMNRINRTTSRLRRAQFQAVNRALAIYGECIPVPSVRRVAPPSQFMTPDIDALNRALAIHGEELDDADFTGPVEPESHMSDDTDAHNRVLGLFGEEIDADSIALVC